MTNVNWLNLQYVAPLETEGASQLHLAILKQLSLWTLVLRKGRMVLGR